MSYKFYAFKLYIKKTSKFVKIENLWSDKIEKNGQPVNLIIDASRIECK